MMLWARHAHCGNTASQESYGELDDIIRYTANYPSWRYHQLNPPPPPHPLIRLTIHMTAQVDIWRPMFLGHIVYSVRVCVWSYGPHRYWSDQQGGGGTGDSGNSLSWTSSPCRQPCCQRYIPPSIHSTSEIMANEWGGKVHQGVIMGGGGIIVLTKKLISYGQTLRYGVKILHNIEQPNKQLINLTLVSRLRSTVDQKAI